MVKVLENRLIDLDLLPGTKEQQEAMRRAKQKDDPDSEEDSWSSSDEYSQGALAHAQHAAIALTSAVGGGVKGVVNTAGNTAHSLGAGVVGTVAGVGKGLGSAAAYGGTAVGKTFGFGGQRRENEKEYEGLSREEARKAKREAKERGKMSDEERWKVEREELEEAQREYEGHEKIRMEEKE